MGALAFRLGGLCVGAGVELVWLAGPTYAADCRAALFDGDESTISAAAIHAVNGAPFVRVGRGAGYAEQSAERGTCSNGDQ